MSQHRDRSWQDIDSLRAAYRSVKAPPYLAARIVARMPDRRPRRRGWLGLATAGALAVVATIALLGPFGQRAPEQLALRTPSLSVLDPAAIKPGRVRTPDLKRLRGLPLLPRSPKRPGESRPPPDKRRG